MNSIIQKLDQLMNSDFDLLNERVDIECKLAIGRDGKGGVPQSLWETYSAFANTNGGIIILGAKETKLGKFEAHGIENISQVKSDLLNTLNNKSKINHNLIIDSNIREWKVNNKVLLLLAIPRASRQYQPIYLHANPLNNTYIRRHEGDYKLDEESVKRMLAEQSYDGLDDTILVNYDLNDLSRDSLKSYRQRYNNLNPHSDLNDLPDIEFLRRIGAFGVNRDTGESGLTKAGLLMFGMHHTITEIFPNYMVDYQERPRAQTEARWIDRVVPDGSWSGNIYDFYRKIYSKLIQDLKIPFELKDGVRQEDTPIHIALREALVNCLVHADYTDRASILIVKRPDMFGFRNPGLMRVPLDIALKGSESDCWNRKIHQMFRFINIGEQAGSGIPKILSGWHSQHWIPPYLHEKREPNNQTLLELTMVDLFPQEIMQQLSTHFGSKFTELTLNERTALALAKLAGSITHSRLQTIITSHSSDITKDLQHLVKEGFLNSSGGRGAVYTLAGVDILMPEDVFNTSNLSSSTPNITISNIPQLGSIVSESSSVINANDSKNIRDEHGRLYSDKLNLPIIDDISKLDPIFKNHLYNIANDARNKKRLDPDIMENLILTLCSEQFFTIGVLAEVLNRKPEALRRGYLSNMIKNQKLCLAFPTTPTHEKQAYRTNLDLTS